MKDKDSYVFRKPNQMLRRETITIDVNRLMHSVSKSLPDQLNITIHSFRIGSMGLEYNNFQLTDKQKTFIERAEKYLQHKQEFSKNNPKIFDDKL